MVFAYLLLSVSLPTAGQAAPARWTIFVYMAGDNDLERFAIANLKQAEAGLPKTGVDVVVFVDRARKNDGRGGDWGGARLYHVRPSTADALDSTVLKDYGSVDSSDPKTLREAVTEAFKASPLSIMRSCCGTMAAAGQTCWSTRIFPELRG